MIKHRFVFASFSRVAVEFVLLFLPRAVLAQTITVGSLTLTRCIAQHNGYCGSLGRPLDASGHVPGTLFLGFEFYPHTDTAQPLLRTIVAEEGGPGYSTIGSRDGYVRLSTPLRTQRDILLVDKRGTGRSAAIDCKRPQQDRFLVAEAEDGAPGGGLAKQFNTGLATAVMCQDYHTLIDMRAPEQERRRQFAAAVAAKAHDAPDLYAPFTLADALAAPAEPEALATCLVWPPPPDATPGLLSRQALPSPRSPCSSWPASWIS